MLPGMFHHLPARLAVFAVAPFTAAAAAAAPCISATASCTEWVSDAGQSRSLIYRSYPLDARNDRPTRAFIMVHGAGRDADRYSQYGIGGGVSGRRARRHDRRLPAIVVAGHPAGGQFVNRYEMANKVHDARRRRHLNAKYGAQHKVSMVSLCLHNARRMFTADPTLALVFPAP